MRLGRGHKQAILGNQARDYHGWNQGGSNREDKKWSYSGYILIAESTESGDGLGCGMSEKEVSSLTGLNHPCFGPKHLDGESSH